MTSRYNRILSTLMALVFIALMVSPVDINAQERINPFGIVEGFWLPEQTCELGVGWERIIFNWEQHQPNEPYDWHTLNIDDRWLKAANECNREVVALLKHSPAWATSGTAGAGVPDGLALPIDHPDNHWANFVRQTAAYYAPRGVHRFIIWNEPDITRDTYGFEFEGELEDYFQLLRVGYLAAKQGNPAAEIHLAGTTYWHDINAGRRLYLDRLLERILEDDAAGQNDYYFDAASLHIYFRTDSVYDIVNETRTLLDDYGLTDKQIWINETNAPPTQDPEWLVDRPVFQYTLEQQASFVVQAAALGLAAGAERIAVYKLYDQNLPVGGETFGILRPDQSIRPAFTAWQTVNVRFQNVTDAQVARTDTIDVVLLTHEDETTTVVAWSRTDQPGRILVSNPDGSFAVVDQYNQSIDVSPDAIPLPAATCNGDTEELPCPVGGGVVIISGLSENFVVQELQAESTIPLEFE